MPNAHPHAKFGFWTGFFVVAASMVGSGILTNSGPILKSTGSYPALFLLWALGGVIAAIGAMTLAELASGLPRSGGDYVFVREAFGPAVGFVYGWSMVLLGFAAPVALVSYTTVNFLLVPLGLPNTPSLVYGGATLLIIAFTAGHCYSHRSSAWLQGATTLFKLAVLLLFAAGGFAGSGSLSHLSAGAPLSAVKFSDYAMGLVLVLYAYTGWNAAAYLAGEIRDAVRTLPWCLILGTAAVAALYLLVNLFYAYAIPAAEVRGMGDAELNRLAEIAVTRCLGGATGALFSLLAGVGVLASLSAYLLTGPRIVYAMAHDRLFPSVAGKLGKTGVPVPAVIFQGAFGILFLWSGSFEAVLTFAGYGLTVLGMLVVLPIFKLRGRADFKPRFRVPGYPFTPAVFLLLSSLTLVGGALDSPRTAALSLLSILFGFPLYYLCRRFLRVTKQGALL